MKTPSSLQGVEQDEPSDVLIGISVFNRREIVSAAARSLTFASDIEEAAILVIDDASSEFDAHYLASIYPPGSQIVRNAIPGGVSSKVTLLLMTAFLQRSESILIILDSDLIVAGDFLHQARSMLSRTDGLLSLFHAHTHPGVEEGPLLRKHSVGFAGTVWTRSLVEEVVAHVPFTSHFDDRICDYLRNRQRKIFSLKCSAVQHIGLLSGENSRFTFGDYGLSFTGTEWYNLSAIDEVLLQGCQREFERQEDQHRRLETKSREAIDELREEIRWLRQAGGLFNGLAPAVEPGSLTWAQRMAARLAQAAFGLLRFSSRSRVGRAAHHALDDPTGLPLPRGGRIKRHQNGADISPGDRPV